MNYILSIVFEEKCLFLQIPDSLVFQEFFRNELWYDTDMRNILFASALLLLIGVIPAHAQLNFNTQGMFNSVGSLAPEVEISLQPEYPRPGELVTANLNDYRSGAFGENITWRLNGEVVPEGTNRRTITFTAGTLGSTDRLEAYVVNDRGVGDSFVRLIRPIYLDIVFEPQTRTPDFYQGRSLPSTGSLVNATALVNDGSFRTDLVYTWRVDQEVIERGPIRGRNQVTFETPRGDGAVVRVQVAEPNGTVLAARAVLMPSVRPELHFYEVSSLYGLDRRPIENGASMTGNSFTVRAEAYNLDSRVFNNPDVKEWSVNNRPAQNIGMNPYEVTLQRSGGAGSSNVSFHVRSLDEILQGAEDGVFINF